MIFYHGTNTHGLSETINQGFLLHKRPMNASPCVYLAVDIDEAKHYGHVILKVEYDPKTNPSMNNYSDGCWQVRVYEPIYDFEVLENDYDKWLTKHFPHIKKEWEIYQEPK